MDHGWNGTSVSVDQCFLLFEMRLTLESRDKQDGVYLKKSLFNFNGFQIDQYYVLVRKSPKKKGLFVFPYVYFRELAATTYCLGCCLLEVYFCLFVASIMTFIKPFEFLTM